MNDTATKVIIRPWRRDDAQQLASVANNRSIWNQVRDRLPSPYTVMDALQWINHCATQQPAVNFAIVYNDKVVGSIGCVPKEDVYRKTVEIGYFIGEPYWNRGIATEAVELLLAYVQRQFSVIRVYAEVFENNKASMQVLRNNGFYLEGIRRKAVIKNNVIMDDYVWVKLL
ncbi:GNAT family N-acetyltransferase [Foetidibacter luteolus]|uniref:GNAT family N-acetyltransferase n=1 Tax=Foetidibacter luteolus TaxID=2608880 RepID=UPI00129A6C36|nr:GNAT family N-acetyltransferase [Foetidibacter luteolus]